VALDRCRLIGAALLLGAWYSRNGSEHGLRALAAAWGLTSGVRYYSFEGHLFRRNKLEVSSLPGWAVTAVAGLGTLIAIYAALSSITHRSFVLTLVLVPSEHLFEAHAE
jgi:hypothetical protein